MDKVFRYYAFISYKHEDEKWAKWLQKRLETYRLPVALQKQNCPKRLKPVFRDNTDITPGNLEEKLYKNLELSNYLIVICSKNLAKESHYVDYEIQTFVNMGRAHKIIPFIIDGEPNAANPNEECFSEFIKSCPGELLAANAKKDGKRIAALKVIASILNLNADDLIQRDKKRKRLNRLLWIIASIFAMITFSITLNLTAQNYENKAVNSNFYNDSSSAIEYAIKSLKVPFNKNESGEAAQILRSHVIADELKKSNNQFHKEFEIKAKTKQIALFAESADGKKVGFTDLSRVFVYDSATGEFLREFHIGTEKDRLESYMGIEIGDEIRAAINGSYESNKKPVNYTEKIVSSGILSDLCIFDKNGKQVYTTFITEDQTKWVYNQNESLIAIYNSQATPFITIYSFDQKEEFGMWTPKGVSRVTNMYFSPKGRYLFVDFFSVLCVYDIESREIVFEHEKEDDCYNLWFLSENNDQQAIYTFSSYKAEKYTYTDKIPDVKNVLYSRNSDLEIYTKNNNLDNIFFSDDGSRAVSVKNIRSQLTSEDKTLYTFFETESGESLSYVYFDRGDDVIDITPDIKYSIICSDNQICIYEIESADILYQTNCNGDSIQSVAISKDGKIAAYLDDQSVLTILTLGEDGKYHSKVASIPKSDEDYKEIVFVNSEKCVTNFGGLMQSYDIASGSVTTITEDAWNNINIVYSNRFDLFSSCKDLSEDGMILESVDIEQYFAFYNADGGTVNAYETALGPCDYSPEKGLLAGSEYTNQEIYNSEIVVIKFDKDSQRELYRYSSNLEVTDVHFDNNGKYVIINGPEGCEVLDALTGNLLFTLDRNIIIHDDTVYDISPDLVTPDVLPRAEIYSVNQLIRQGKKIIR